MTNSLLLERITTQSESTPYIRDTHVAVVTILESIAEGLTIEEILERHSGLEIDDIRAVAAYADDFPMYQQVLSLDPYHKCLVLPNTIQLMNVPRKESKCDRGACRAIAAMITLLN